MRAERLGLLELPRHGVGRERSFGGHSWDTTDDKRMDFYLRAKEVLVVTAGIQLMPELGLEFAR